MSIIQEVMFKKAEELTSRKVGFYWEYEEKCNPIIEVFSFGGEMEVNREKMEIIKELEMEGIGQDKVEVNCYIFTAGCYRLEMYFDFNNLEEKEFSFMIELLKNYGEHEYLG
jgi:hypothetical protein